MPVRATFTKSFLRRYLLIALVFLGYGAYCAYDGFIAYPREFEAAEEYAKLEGLESGIRQERWEKIRQEKRWKLKPDTHEQVQSRIYWQYIMGGVCLIVGVPAMFKFAMCRNSWVEATPTGWKTSWGQSVEYRNVKSLNKRKWTNKGIARAIHVSDGRQQTFVFDDFKFEREPLGEILRSLESQLTDEQIVDGVREPEKKSTAKTDADVQG